MFRCLHKRVFHCRGRVSRPVTPVLSTYRQKKLRLLVCANFIFSKKGQKTAPFCVVKRTVGKRSFGYSVCSFLFSLPLRGRFASGAKSLAGFAEKRVRGDRNAVEGVY